MSSEEFVKVWQEEVTIPTYPVGDPDRNPMFFEKRVYQGSSGVVYPNPIIEKIYDEKEDRTYKALFLENNYLKIMILPEIGGRVQMAWDKVKQRHFVYHNQVIKPALVGLLGPWISGGIEFNWPQHHRPSTFQPIDYHIEENDDGSVTAWTNEIERMFHTKALAGFTLYPDKAYLEINAQIYNRTDLYQTFLWWANPAVSVNDYYQSVFPPDVNAVFDHGKRDVATFPIAQGTYYKVDYSPGTDISRYKNIPVPTSYMAIQSDYDFVGGYEHDTEGGLLHVANHHISPGKKQWTWGNGDFGHAWDRNLTDEDGPYIELMTGVYTDNQPDFTWLMPHEEKSFSQYFMPYQELGVVKNATKDIMVNIEPDGQHRAEIMIYTTSRQPSNLVRLYVDGKLVNKDQFDAEPGEVYEKTVEFEPKITEKNYVLVVEDRDGKELIRYEPAKNKEEEIPEPAKPAKDPEEVENTEQLYLTGQHLEQYRHATYSPVSYYREALKRDPGDVRNNNALGVWYLRRGRFEKSEPYFRKAIETLTERNPNPYNGEPYYNLGLCLKHQARLREAYEALYKATWNGEWQHSAFFLLAQIDVINNDLKQALYHLNWSLDRNMRNGRAHHLKATVLRKLGRFDEALDVCDQALEYDRFNLGGYLERYHVRRAHNMEDEAVKAIGHFQQLSRGDVQNHIEYALDYAAAGCYDEAIDLLNHVAGEEISTYPMVWYYLGWFYDRRNKSASALTHYQKGATADPDHCFPDRLEAIRVLKRAQITNPKDARAPYYLGCLWYDKRQHEAAIDQWELAAQKDDTFPTVFRNLGLAYFNKRNNPSKALDYYERAFALNDQDARIFMELDQLYKRTNRPPQERLEFLEKNLDLVEERDDVYLERAAIYNFLGEYQTAYDLIMDRKFHPWEGGEGKVSGQYVYSLVELAKQDYRSNQYEAAIEKLQQAREYPPNLGEGKLYVAKENDIFYWLGCCYEELGKADLAEECWQKATEGPEEPTLAMFYNDQPPEKILYQGLAWQKLGDCERSTAIFDKLINYGRKHRNDNVKIDYFAVSLPDLLIFDDDQNLRNKIHCTFMMGLGHLGKGEINKSGKLLENILEMEVMHFGAKTHLRILNLITVAD